MATIRDAMIRALQVHQSGDLPQAERMYREVLQRDPNQADAHNLLGTIAIQVGKPDAAIDLIRRALAVQPAEAEFHTNMATALKGAGDVAAAVTHYREALRLKPDALNPRIYLSDTLLEQGDRDEALSQCLESLRRDRDSALAWCVLGELVGSGKHTFTDADILHMQQLAISGRLGPHDRSILFFTLAAHWERLGDYDRAFDCYQKANALKHEVYRAAGKAFDPGQHEQFINALIEYFTANFFEQRRYYGADSETPVFVVGMVRSGTSLVEQILASHPLAHGAGELRDIDQTALNLPQQLKAAASYPACLTALDPAAARTVAYAYMQRLTRGSGAVLRAIDKMPSNFLHLGLIAVLFPRARVIHCRRDPMDVCTSAYFQNFKWLPHAARLEDIAFFHRHYERLLAHWRSVLPLRMHEVVYEDLVASQEKVSRDLLAFCGLDWDPSCLHFHRSTRAVQTASKLQVREPIYTRSVLRWKRFEHHLKPLREALASAQTDPRIRE